MNYESRLQTVVGELAREVNPVSIFTYGSYNTSDFLPGISDVEIGVVKGEEGQQITQKLVELGNEFSSRGVILRVYPFSLVQLQKSDVDTPHTKSVFLRLLKARGRTIYGEQIVENLIPPPITLLDAYREAVNSTSRALDGWLFFREGLSTQGLEWAYKGTLYGTRALSFLRGIFPVTFLEIYELSKELELPIKWEEHVDAAYRIRTRKLRPNKNKSTEFIFSSITYCNQVVEPQIKAELQETDKVLIK